MHYANTTKYPQRQETQEHCSWKKPNFEALKMLFLIDHLPMKNLKGVEVDALM